MGAIVPPPFARPQKASVVEETVDVVAESGIVSKVAKQGAACKKKHTHTVTTEKLVKIGTPMMDA